MDDQIFIEGGWYDSEEVVKVLREIQKHPNMTDEEILSLFEIDLEVVRNGR